MQPEREQAYHWRQQIGKQFVHICCRTLHTHTEMTGRERIQCPTILGMLEGITGEEADAVGPSPDTAKASSPAPSSAPAIVAQAITHEIQRYSHTLEIVARKERQARRRLTRKRLNGPEGMANAFARLRDNMAQPLRAVRRSDGSITADPDEIDAITTKAWGRIYNGTGRTHKEAVEVYLRYNDPFLFRRTTAFQLPEIQARDLQISCRGAPATAAGPDCWAPAEWATHSYG